MLKYKKVDRSKVSILYRELAQVNHEINDTFETPSAILPELNKTFKLEGLDLREDFIIMNIALQKGIIKFSAN
jgi:hypothetical protein